MTNISTNSTFINGIQELSSLRQWVFWKRKERNDRTGKPYLTKVPYNPNSGHKASTTDRGTWGTFEQAKAANDERDGDGIGFVFSDADPYCGIDLDDCREPDTGEVAAWAAAVVKWIDSYAEISPSGTGIKIFLQGTKPGNPSRTKYDSGEIEVYDQDRFFTVTGDQLPDTPDTVNVRQDRLTSIYREIFGPDQRRDTGATRPTTSDLTDDQVITEATRISPAFRRLFHDGDLNGSDRSGGQWGLIRTIQGYTEDPDQIERVVRQSALDDSRWDEPRHNGGTYLRYDINRALETPADWYYEPSSPVSFSLSLSSQGREGKLSSIPTDNLEQGIQAEPFGKYGRPDPVAWVVKDLIPAKYPSTFFGAGGDGKSFLGLDLAQHVAAGRDWLGYTVNQSRVVFLDFELDRAVQGARAYDLAAGMGLDAPPDDLLYLSALEMNTHTAFTTTLDICRDQDIGLVIVDSIGPAMQGDAESSADVIGFMDRYIKPLKAAGVAVLMIDHQAKVIKGENAKDKLPFGSVYKTNLSRSIIQVRGRWDENVLNAQLRHVKTNFGPKQDDFEARLTFHKNKITVTPVEDGPGAFDGEDVTAADKIVDALRTGPQYVEQLTEITGYSRKTVQNKLSDLRKAEKIEYTGERQGQSRQIRLIADDNSPDQDSFEDIVIDLTGYQSA